MWQVTYDMWQVTHDMWHMTHDTYCGMNILSKFQLPSSFGFGLTVFWIYFHKPWLSYLMSHKAIYKTAPATPGLLNILWFWEGDPVTTDSTFLEIFEETLKNEEYYSPWYCIDWYSNKLWKKNKFGKKVLFLKKFWYSLKE